MLFLLLFSAYGLLILADCIDAKNRRRGLLGPFLFILGCILLLCCFFQPLFAAGHAGTLHITLFSGGFFLLFLLLLLYPLIPARGRSDRQAAEPGKLRLVSSGIYALCRHPGILCFFGLYLCLGLAALPGGLLAHGLAFSLLDLAYAGFQDRVTFPKTFCDYEAYRKKAPFLIPTGDSIRRARQTWGRPASEEERP